MVSFAKVGFEGFHCNHNFKLFSISVYLTDYPVDRNDEKTAQDYKVQGGSVLHLVLALRGGSAADL